MGTVVACAVVRDDPPRVFVAENLETLNWVLANQLVAKTPGRDLPPGERAALRQALREERWGDAVFAFIARTGTPSTCTRAPSSMWPPRRRWGRWSCSSPPSSPSRRSPVERALAEARRVHRGGRIGAGR